MRASTSSTVIPKMKMFSGPHMSRISTLAPSNVPHVRAPLVWGAVRCDEKGWSAAETTMIANMTVVIYRTCIHAHAHAHANAHAHTHTHTRTMNFMLLVPDASMPAVETCSEMSAAGITATKEEEEEEEEEEEKITP